MSNVTTSLFQWVIASECAYNEELDDTILRNDFIELLGPNLSSNMKVPLGWAAFPIVASS